MDKKIVIALDCMGGDNAPFAVIGGVELALKKMKNDDLFFLLCGNEADIEKCLLNKSKIRNKCRIMHTENCVSNDMKPHLAVRKKDTSMRKALELVRDGGADAVISAGNTGAYMALAKIILKDMPEIERPALIQLMPNYLGQSTALLDMGANLECNSTNLFQFAIMGWAYYKAVNNIQNPSIAILNIGSEEMKGNDMIKNTSIMLRESLLKDNFKGYIEGDEILKGDINVVVTDGFTGNIVLKAIEGTSKFFAFVIRNGFRGSIFAMFGYLFARKSINKAKSRIDHKRYNGAMLVGVNGIVVKSHGNADRTSYFFAIQNTINLIKNKINEDIAEHIFVVDK
ncbi:MAG: phosphate acyltransferase PlsX [Rickettsiales bacterium]|jgi:glycerol-3-phosphate acyltransferase PlsX|nr:phosphate acyltransferase PlsX [Rickettsiales bacterium]